MNTELQFLQELEHDEFCELVLVPLLSSIGYHDVRSTYSVSGDSRDLVFTCEEPLRGETNLGAIVKRRPLEGETELQIWVSEVQAATTKILTEPQFDPFDGTEIKIEHVSLFSPDPLCQAIHQFFGKDPANSTAHRPKLVDGPEVVRLLERFHPTLLVSLPDPASRYLQSLCNRFIDNPSLGKVGEDRDLSTPDIYTGGLLSPTTPDEAKYVSFAEPSMSKNRSQLRSILNNCSNLVVLADVGSGKTTLLQKMIIDAYNVNKVLAESQDIPIFIPLAQLSHEHLATYDSFLNGVSHIVRNDQGFTEFSLEKKTGNTLLLDGFDELPGDHESVAQYIDTLAGSNFASVILTSRPSRIPKLSTKFSFFRLTPFTDEDIHTFIFKWFSADNQKRDQMLHQIMDSYTIRSFCRTPLILTLYSILGSRKNEAKVPDRKTDVYLEISKLLLGDWDSRRSVVNHFDDSIKEYVLEEIAFEAHSADLRHFSEVAAMKIIQDALENRRIKKNPQLLLNELIYRSSLVRSSHRNRFEFVHLSFQEFFVARRLSRMQDLRLVEKKLFNPWWRNVCLFYFGLRKTLDGISFTKEKRVLGRGLQLLEYMIEAEYTSSSFRERVMAQVAKDVLHSSALVQSELDTCTKLGDEIVAFLSENVERPRFNGVYYNYMKILAMIGTDRSIEKLAGTREHIRSIGIEELPHILVHIDKMLNGIKETEFAVRLLEELREKSKSARLVVEKRKSVIENLRNARKVFKAIKDEGVVPRHIVRKVEALFKESLNSLTH